MLKKKQTSSTYDEMFVQGSTCSPYHMHYSESWYFPMYQAVLKEIRRSKAERILEVGCGTGGFAHLLMERYPISYRGFDFSPVAVEKAIARTNSPKFFFVANALTPELYKNNASTIVCTEVLEHIPQDLKLVELWPVGTYCICSAPRASALETHIREGHFLRVINVLSKAPQRLLFAGVSKFGLVHDSFPFGVQEQAS